MTSADPATPRDPAEHPAVRDASILHERQVGWRVWGVIMLCVVAALVSLVLHAPRLHPVIRPLPCELVQLHTPRAVPCP